MQFMEFSLFSLPYRIGVKPDIDKYRQIFSGGLSTSLSSMDDSDPKQIHDCVCVGVFSRDRDFNLFAFRTANDGTYSFDLNPYFHGFLLIGNVFVPFVIMIILYSKIYIIAKRHARRAGNAMSSTSNTRSSRSHRRFAREVKLAKTLGIVVLFFVICWLPFEMINVLILMDEGVINCAMEIADTVACWFAYLHSSMNPLLYAFASSEFRRAFKKLLFINREATLSMEAAEIHSHSKTGAGRSNKDQPSPVSDLKQEI